MISIIDYGVGNLYSIKSSFAAIGVESVVTNDENTIYSSDGILLPGVGAFSEAINKLKESKMDIIIRTAVERGIPVMGICLGMQLLFDKSYEYGEYDGLGLIHGSIVPLSEVVPGDYKVPHIGWNPLKMIKDSRLFKYIKDGDCVYFVHSYYASDCDNSITAVAEYSVDVTACVENGNVFGCQFHPEKSGPVGLNILKAFSEVCLK